MAGWPVVLSRIFSMCLVILAGWAARRSGYLTRETVKTMSRLAVDVALSALCFTRLLSTVTLDSLRTYWIAPVLGGAIIIVSELIGVADMKLFCRSGNRRTYVFLIALPNWLYLPLPIVEGLFPGGDEGVQVLLLFNAGLILVAWSLGIATLRGVRPNREAFKKIASTPSLVASAAAILLALAVPSLGTLDKIALAKAPWPLFSAGIVYHAADVVGSLAVPVSLLMIGASMAQMDVSRYKPSMELVGVAASRLLLAPLAIVLVAKLAGATGLDIPDVPRIVCYLIASMPVAVTAGILAERYDGDTALAAGSIFYTMILSIGTVPAFFFLIERLGL